MGGLEPKYQKLHEDTINAINEWLLYRPMIKDKGWDILFPAKVSTGGNPDVDLIPDFEITHLTCFLGGMYALGGKIFGREADIETAKKLTDGCVWAYQSTPSGVMPEWSQVVPCPTLDECEFNETLWWEHLDPAKEWREKEMVKWEALEAKMIKTGKSEALNQQELRKTEKATEPAKTGGYRSNDLDKKSDEAAAPAASPILDDDVNERPKLGKRDSVSPQQTEKKLPLEDEEGSALPDSLKEKLNLSHEKTSPKAEDGDSSSTKAEKQITEPGSANTAPSGYTEPLAEPAEDPPNVPWPRPEQVEKPLTHEEFIKQKLETEPLPPGYSSIGSPHYILR